VSDRFKDKDPRTRFSIPQYLMNTQVSVYDLCIAGHQIIYRDVNPKIAKIAKIAKIVACPKTPRTGICEV
jgi:hypothetical protein